MRRIADLHPGNAKTDARDAFVIADAARALPGSLRSISADDEEIADLKMLAGFDDDLAADATRMVNRIRGVLVDVHPALERAIGPYLDKTVGPAVLAKFGGPVGLSTTSRRSLHSLITKHAPRAHQKILDRITTALADQSVIIPGSRAADRILKVLATQLLSNMEA